MCLLCCSPLSEQKCFNECWMLFQDLSDVQHCTSIDTSSSPTTESAMLELAVIENEKGLFRSEIFNVMMVVSSFIAY
jgi:hypothetical protein